MLTATSPPRVWTPGHEPALPPPPRPPWPFRRGLPTFLVIGAQKAGTTWLFEHLRRHPRIFGSRPKELHYFSNPDHYGAAWDEYRWRFARGRRLRPWHLVAGEGTPNYLWVSDHGSDRWGVGDDPDWRAGVPDRIAAALGEDLRFVVMLRDPVDRAISALYHHVGAEGRIDPDRPFLENARGFGIVSMGFYAAHLERYLERFDPCNVLVLIQEEVLAHPEEALATVQAHLGVRVDVPDDAATPIHTSRKHQGPDGCWYFDERHERVAVDHDDIAHLEEVFAPENARLERLLGRPIGCWRHAGGGARPAVAG